MTRPPEAAPSSRPSQSKRKAEGSPKGTASSDALAAAAAPRLLKPRRGLFVLLLSAWAVWISALAWMYFSTLTARPSEQAPATTLRAVASR
ncbi:MAG TPA: hypothetical protein VER17_17340 [Tepidisphaeraceae bacterium]|nr:hypothetical protein [Tepidisphaeraceae bacterium]